MRILNELLKVIGLCASVTLIWQTLEYIILGEVIQSSVDSIIASILVVSLYHNLKGHGKEKGEGD